MAFLEKYWIVFVVLAVLYIYSQRQSAQTAALVASSGGDSTTADDIYAAGGAVSSIFEDF